MNRSKFVRILCIVLAILMVVSLLAMVIPTRASAEDDDSEDDFEQQLAELNQQKEAARNSVSSARNKVEQLKEEQALVIEEKIALEERNAAAQEAITLVEDEISLISDEISKFEIRIAIREKRVEAAKAKEDEQLEKYRVRIRAMEENGGYNILAILLNADSLSELLTAIDDYGDIMNSDKVLYDQLQIARSEHEAVKAEYEAYKAECEATKDKYDKELYELEKEKEELEKEIEDSAALIEEYTEKIKEAEEEQKRMEQLEAAAAAAAANFIAEYQAKKAAEAAAAAAAAALQGSSGNSGQVSSGDGSVTGLAVEGGGAAVETPAPGTAVSGSGSFTWPFPGHTNISSPFGYRPSTGTYHTGIDIDGYASMGSPIVAADSGTVIKAEYYGGYGNCIIIDHGNGFTTLYAHLSSMYVGVGSYVSKGQTIAGVGNSGTVYGADGIHLHFEVTVNGSRVDPLGYL